MTDEPLSSVSVSAPSVEEVGIRLAEWESGGDEWVGCGNIAGEWRRACREHASEVAVCWGAGSWTYNEFGERIEALAASLRSKGVQAGDRVGASMRERRFWPLAMLAIARAGGIYVPLDLNVPEPRLKSVISDAGVGLIVSDDEQVAERFGCEWLSVETESSVGVKEDAEGPRVFALLYTSGSTGEPKGVMVDHAGVINEVTAMGKLLELTPGDRVLQFSSPGFDASLEEMLACLLSGATLVPRADSAMADFSSFSASIENQEITVLNMPTAFLTAWSGWMRELGLRMTETARAAVTGGERLSAQAVEDWQASGGGKVRLLNTYGPTEASIAATCQIIDEHWNEAGDPPIGRPLAGFRVRIEKTDTDEWGELWIGGVSVGSGYWNRKEQTAAAFREIDGERWYLTGDLAKWDEQGRLVFGGRKDDQLKIRGHRIEPDEVIRVLESHADVSKAHVGAIESERGVLLAGWVKWIGDAPEEWASLLRNYLRKSLPEASVPVRWARVDEFKLTERDKLDRKALPDPELAGPTNSEAPSTETEVALAKIWSTLLEVSEVGRDDDFFDLGGSSLLALRLFGRIKSNFGVSLPMAELLRASRLKSLAEVIDGDKETVDDGIPNVIPLREGSARSPLFCIHGGDGGVLFYRELALHLPKGVPLLTVESPELRVEGMVGVGTIEEMAVRYLKAVKKRQPEGPYHLAGYSFGGVMVYEMARLLVEAGEEVEFLGLFDTENPSVKWRKYGLGERMKVYWNAHASFSWLSRCGIIVSRALEGVATNLRVRAEVSAANEAGLTEAHSKLRMLQVRESHGAAMDAYVPPPLDLEVVLFKTEAVDDKFDVAEDYGWSSLVRNLRILDVPGEHLTMFNREYVQDLAKEMEKVL
ncbi:amino acid adenylation domain-containing protein [Haloferula sp.]|uniref:amino acid adenylation domain-containing protein n=1 Tax=Haloferula sp. TaxID=2497595 RepID=UPI00329F9356